MTPFLMILTIGAVTILIRALPFLLFPPGKHTPSIILYLGDVLPYGVIAMLVVYCLRNISFASFPYGAQELLGSAFVIFLHLWKKNTLLSISGGTFLYLLLYHFIF